MAWWSIVYQAWYSTLDTRGLLLFLSLLEVELADVTCSEDLHQVGSWRQSREKKPIAVIIIIIMVCGKGLVDYLQINLDTPFSLPLHCLIPLHNSSPQCTLGNFLNPKGAQNYDFWNRDNFWKILIRKIIKISQS